jgi:5-methylthioadenosine/S-adenosylhomocysteine deaminase
MLFHAADRAVKRVLIDGETVFDGKPVGLDPVDAGGRLAEAQARMLRAAGRNDYRGRSADMITPLSLPSG